MDKKEHDEMMKKILKEYDELIRFLNMKKLIAISDDIEKLR